MKLYKLCFILTFILIVVSISSVYADDNVYEDIDLTTNEITVNDPVNPVNDYSDANNANIYPVSSNKSIENEQPRSLPQSSYISANDLVKYYKGDEQYYATFYSDLNGNLLANYPVTIWINGVNYTRTTNSSGMIKVSINLSPGEYIIKAYHPYGGEQDNSITVISTIEGHNLNMFYQDGSKFTVRNLDKNGNPLPYSIVNFNVNGVLYNRTANATGHASLNINLIWGVYVITATSFYNNLAMGYTINIFHPTAPKDTSNAIITPIKKCVYQGENYVAKLCQNNGLPLANEQLTVIIDGNSYTLTTDNKGFVYLSTYTLSIGTHVLHIYYGSIHVQRNLIVSSHVLGSDNIITPLNTVVWSGNSFQVKITDNNNNPLSNVEVYMYINKTTNYTTTNSNGIASFVINLNPGIYPMGITSASTNGTNYNPISIYKLIYVANSASDNNFNPHISPDIYPENTWISPIDYFPTECQNDSANPDSEYISSLADLLTKYDDELENIISINNYVSYTTYENYLGSTKNATSTLITFAGNCVDETNAVVALARASGIGARYVSGTPKYSGNGHMWGQLLVDGVWICFDTSATTSGYQKWSGDFKLGNKEYLTQNFNINGYYLLCCGGTMKSPLLIW